MCLPVPEVSRHPARSFEQFLQGLDIPLRDGRITARLTGSLPCGCRPSAAARKSGQRGFTITADGKVIHTRETCGKVLARFADGRFVVVEDTARAHSTRFVSPTATIQPPAVSTTSAPPSDGYRNPCSGR